ncbi:hypothetical protein D3C87_1725740 [compost metagenome]
MDNFRIYKTLKTSQLDRAADPTVKDISSVRVYALPENHLAQSLISTSNSVEKLEQLSEEQLKEFLNEKMMIAKAIEEKQSVMSIQAKYSPELHAIDAGTIQAFMQGLLDSDSLNYLTTILPEAQ